MPDGNIMRNMVVSIHAGSVNDIYCFTGEAHSMILVDDIYLSVDNSLEAFSDIRKTSRLEEGERFYAYLLNVSGELTLIKD